MGFWTCVKKVSKVVGWERCRYGWSLRVHRVQVPWVSCMSNCHKCQPETMSAAPVPAGLRAVPLPRIRLT